MMLGAIAIGVTGYNALGPLFVGWAWENGRGLFVVPAGSLMWVVFVGFSLLCAVGFTASNRGAVTGSREAEAARLDSARKSLSKTENDLAALKKPPRAAAVIEESLNAMRQDRRWLSTKGCTEATVDASRDYCRGYFQARQEQQTALEYARLDQVRERQNADVLRLKMAGAGRETDPQASMLVRLTRGMVDLAEAQLWLNSWAALVVEMGAALIPAVALGHGFSGRRRREEEQARAKARNTPGQNPGTGAVSGRDVAGAAVGQSAKGSGQMEHYVVSVGGQKGGTGKSTVAQGIAVEAARTGRMVLLADLDVKQATSAEWAKRRKAAGHQPVIEARLVAQRQVWELQGRRVTCWR